MAARLARLGYCGLMSAKTARSSPPMRTPILNRKKTYGRAKKPPPPKSCPPLSVEAVDTPTPQTTARLDKAETIELAKRTLHAICLAPDAPSNAKATAARTLLELVGALGRHA